MNDESFFKFDRPKVPNRRVHVADLPAERIPMSLKDKVHLAIIGLVYLAGCTMSYYWG